MDVSEVLVNDTKINQKNKNTGNIEPQNDPKKDKKIKNTSNSEPQNGRKIGKLKLLDTNPKNSQKNEIQGSTGPQNAPKTDSLKTFDVNKEVNSRLKMLQNTAKTAYLKILDVKQKMDPRPKRPENDPTFGSEMGYSLGQGILVISVRGCKRKREMALLHPPTPNIGPQNSIC